MKYKLQTVLTDRQTNKHRDTQTDTTENNTTLAAPVVKMAHNFIIYLFVVHVYSFIAFRLYIFFLFTFHFSLFTFSVAATCNKIL